MLSQSKTRLTLDEFAHLVEQNPDQDYEWIEGELCEVVADTESSEIAAMLLVEIGILIKQKKLGRVTGADGGYIIDGERYIPDIAFTRTERIDKSQHHGYLITPPDLAVEVVSPSDTADRINIKLRHYLAAGVRVWVVYPSSRTVSVVVPGMPFRVLTVDDTLEDGDILPGFVLALKDLFEAD